MIHLTSLLMCLISAGNNVAALQTAQSSVNEARPGLPPWEQRYGIVGPKSFLPQRHDDFRGSQKHSSVIDPKSFSINIQGPPSNTQDSSSQVFSSLSKDPNKHPQSSTQPGWHLKFSLPFPTTMAAPTSKSEVNVNAGFLYSGSSQGKVLSNPFKLPGEQKPDDKKPSENAQKQSQLVTFLNKLLIPGVSSGQSNQNGQTNVQTQQDKVVFKPSMQQLSHSYTGGISFTQAPVQSVHYHPKWLHLHKPQTSDEDIRKILQYVQNVNGQLMIPVEKCPGFENFGELIKGHYHQHGQFPYGYVHQHPQPPYMHVHQHGRPPHAHVQHPQPSHVHIHQHGKPPHVHIHQHGKPPHVHVHQQGHIHSQWHPPNSHIHSYGSTAPPSKPVTAKPNYAEFFLHVGGPVPNPSKPSQEANVHLGVYKEFPVNGWQKFSGGQPPKPVQTYTYMHQVPDKQQSGEHSQHLHYRGPIQSYEPYRPRWP